jgi:hypothetical protein
MPAYPMIVPWIAQVIVPWEATVVKFHCATVTLWTERAKTVLEVAAAQNLVRLESKVTLSPSLLGSKVM